MSSNADVYIEGAEDGDDLLLEDSAEVTAAPATYNRPFTVAIEGNIGSGKTTLIEKMSHYRGVTVFPEPVDEWRDVDGHDLLAMNYANRERWSFTFQQYAANTIQRTHEKSTPTPIKIMERSIHSWRYCFVENLQIDEVFHDVEFAILNDWYKHNASKPEFGVDLVLYMKTEPEIAYKRACQRDENPPPLDLFFTLDSLHDNWLIHCWHGKCPKVIVVNQGDPEQMAKEYIDVIRNEHFIWQSRKDAILAMEYLDQ